MSTNAHHVANAWRLIGLMESAAVTQVVRTIAALGVADRLAGDPQPVAELAAAVGADPDGLRRLLRVACTLELVVPAAAADAAATDGAAADTYALTELGMLLADMPGSLRDYVLMRAAPVSWQPMGLLEQAVRTGKPVAQRALGQPVWEYYRDHPEEGALFATAMTALSGLLADAVAGAADLRGRQVIVDVGGGRGALLARLLAAAPQARGVVLDQPEVVAEAPPVERLRFVGGDFFAEVPSGDAYLLSHVLHNWDDEHATEILRGCHRAAQPGAVLHVIEVILPDRPVEVGPELLNLHVLTHHGGRERTCGHYARLLSAAGWQLTDVCDLRIKQSMLRAYRV